MEFNENDTAGAYEGDAPEEGLTATGLSGFAVFIGAAAGVKKADLGERGLPEYYRFS